MSHFPIVFSMGILLALLTSVKRITPTAKPAMSLATSAPHQ
jgi:hypothetical protein